MVSDESVNEYEWKCEHVELLVWDIVWELIEIKDSFIKMCGWS